MPNLQIPVGSHFFTPEALQTALSKAIPATELGPGQHGAAVATVDANGLQVALVFSSKNDHWRVRTAYELDWSGDNRIAGDILYKF